MFGVRNGTPGDYMEQSMITAWYDRLWTTGMQALRARKIYTRFNSYTRANMVAILQAWINIYGAATFLRSISLMNAIGFGVSNLASKYVEYTDRLDRVLNSCGQLPIPQIFVDAASDVFRPVAVPGSRKYISGVPWGWIEGHSGEFNTQWHVYPGELVTGLEDNLTALMAFADFAPVVNQWAALFGKPVLPQAGPIYSAEVMELWRNMAVVVQATDTDHYAGYPLHDRTIVLRADAWHPRLTTLLRPTAYIHEAIDYADEGVAVCDHTAAGLFIARSPAAGAGNMWGTGIGFSPTDLRLVYSIETLNSMAARNLLFSNGEYMTRAAEVFRHVPYCVATLANGAALDVDELVEPFREAAYEATFQPSDLVEETLLALDRSLGLR
jgi:hypothetical protein